MKYSLTRKTKPPSRGYERDAGIDIYVPDITQQFINDLYYLNDLKFNMQVDILNKSIILFPHKRIKLPTGVHFDIPPNNMLLVLQKTSIPNKTGIISGARVIDSSYQGEFIASLINTSDKEAILEQGQKFIQLVLVPINQDYSLEEISTVQELYKNSQHSHRGANGFGSTGLF